MGFDEDYEKFNYYIEDKIEELKDTEGWADSKIAYYLRDLAQSLDPKGRKAKKITIDPLKISDKELSKFPENIQDKVNKIREKFALFKEAD